MPPPTSASHNAWRTTAATSASRLAPCNCDTAGVSAMITPDMNSISGQNRLPPSATPGEIGGTDAARHDRVRHTHAHLRQLRDDHRQRRAA